MTTNLVMLVVEELNVSVSANVEMKKIGHSFIEVACLVLQNWNMHRKIQMSI